MDKDFDLSEVRYDYIEIRMRSTHDPDVFCPTGAIGIKEKTYVEGAEIVNELLRIIDKKY